MQYIMVTSWENHWDNLPNNSTYYTVKMLKDEELKKEYINNTKTIFIKRNKETRVVEKCWEGTVFDFFQKDSKTIYFKVNIEREINCPIKYLNFTDG